MDLLTETTHKRWCDDHQKSIKTNKKRVMRLKPRATYKSTIYGIGTILWVYGCFSTEIRILYTSANSLLLQEISDKISQYLGDGKSDTLYSLIFGVTKDTTAKNTSDVINIKGRSGKGFSLVFKTAGSSVVGSHPNLAILDDVVDQNDRDSLSVREGKEQWFDGIVPLLVPFTDVKSGVTFESIFYIGTTWHLQDLTHHIRKRNEKLPDSQKWDIESEGLCDENGNTNYPDFISNERIAELKNSMSDVAFASQYLNDPLGAGLQMFDLKKLTFVRPDQIDLRLGEMRSFFDPSLGGKSNDYPMIIWIHSHNDKLTVIDAIDEKIELSLIVHQIAAKNQEYGCRGLTFESNGVTLIEQSLRDAHDRIGYKIHLDPVHHSSNKHERICSIQPDLYSGRVQFLSDYLTRYPTFMNQIVFYGALTNDDGPDVLELGISYYRRAHFTFKRYEACL